MRMKKILIGVVVFGVVFGGGFGVRKFVLQRRDQFGNLRVESIPRTKVFLNDKEVGQTPYLGENLKAGEYRLKLQDWETTVKITPELLTYVTREFGEETSSQILFLEKLPANASELAIVSDPDGATVSIDSLPKGQAPLLLKDLSLGDKTITVAKDGFADQI
ncbi:PEGA domain-containing protein, partial [Candidatus Gottesmanbacteria bacterium]|nr:PEGA domain-containing protein [Candidatus Gottesmanbacteria bacterium]